MEQKPIKIEEISYDQLRLLWFDQYHLKQKVDADFETINKLVNAKVASLNEEAKKKAVEEAKKKSEEGVKPSSTDEAKLTAELSVAPTKRKVRPDFGQPKPESNAPVIETAN